MRDADEAHRPDRADYVQSRAEGTLHAHALHDPVRQPPAHGRSHALDSRLLRIAHVAYAYL
jgi:hypothetical protein